MIIGVTGLARTGKNVVADYLKEKYGYQVLVFSDVLREEAAKRGMEPTKMNLSELGDQMRAEGGMGVLAKKLIAKLEDEKDYVLTGFRSPDEVDYIRNEAGGDFYLVEVRAERNVRFKRRDDSDPKTEAEFFLRDERDIENKGMAKVIEMADYRLENNGTIDQLKRKVDSLLLKIKEESG
jgi:dephospho-CoA kinase